jgi:predicted nucleotidyltransferase
LDISEIKNALQPLFSDFSKRIGFVYCFGSQVDGSPGIDSDIDLAFYLDPFAKTQPDIRLDLYAQSSRLLKKSDIDIVILNSLSNLVLQEQIIRHGVLLYDRDPELRRSYEVNTLHRSMDFRQHRKLVMGI